MVRRSGWQQAPASPVVLWGHIRRSGMNIYFMGPGIGTDAGGWYIGPDGKIHRVPGWNPEAMTDLTRAVSVIRDAAQLKTPRLAESVLKAGVLEFAFKEVQAHVQGGGILVMR